jgi:hypothetical protein
MSTSRPGLDPENMAERATDRAAPEASETTGGLRRLRSFLDDPPGQREPPRLITRARSREGQQLAELIMATRRRGSRDN